MRINVKAYLFYVLFAFAFDSLFKVSLGVVNLQLPIFFLLLIFPIIFFGSGYFSYFFKANIFLFIYVAYSFMDVFSANNIGVYLKLFSHLVLFIIVYFSVYYFFVRYGVEKLALYLVLGILCTGIFQYALYNLLGVQITLAGVQDYYYLEGGSIQNRMRGFFLEPNWFGLSLFMSFIIFSENVEVTIKKTLVSVLVFIALYLSDNRIILALFLLYMLVVHIPINGLIRLRVTVLVLSILGFVLLVLVSGVIDLFGDRSLSARSISFQRALEYLIYDEKMLFGYGLSNWGDFSNLYGLGKLNFSQDQDLISRDTGELHVILFEQGVLGVFLLLADSIFIIYSSVRNVARTSIGAVFVVMSFVIVAMFYPVFTYAQYLIAYFMARSILIGRPIYDIHRSEGECNAPAFVK